jgi:hypothetical protein
MITHQPPDILLWASVLEDEELLGKSGSRVRGVNKKLKNLMDSTLSESVPSVSNFFSLVTKGMWRFSRIVGRICFENLLMVEAVKT